MNRWVSSSSYWGTVSWQVSGAATGVMPVSSTAVAGVEIGVIWTKSNE